MSRTYDPIEKAPVPRQQQYPLSGDPSQGYSISWNDASSVPPPAYETVIGSPELNPLQRSPPASLAYPPFQPATLVSISENLQNGFPLTLPPSAIMPHPFTLHDVHEQDWKAFLLDVQAAAPSTSNSKPRSGQGMMFMMMPMAAAIGAAAARRRASQAKEDGLNHVHGAIDSWNKYFFHPRRMHVSLTQDRAGGSGPDISSDDESSSDEAAGASTSLMSRRRERRESRRARRTERRQERQERRASRRSQGGKWRIVVTYRDRNM
ncbi:uncharacterized protein LAESUDRAFT_715377 [Laetiporus sulphureus 93-53]|uniref:Uncharacterized protein n=1 Tax=Laetiporus sulphureus 93-53 TaxID=1314785 RepID=A0A165DGP1_9APHY|nr:uncharacterized protein LAESUDRAFT_715377 [Laetiporus sulphureus 93-53]KZT04844.1 hypothetical protein LAESUDRAFT_715377 [Laetiporus sulphureus 93-53]